MELEILGLVDESRCPIVHVGLLQNPEKGTVGSGRWRISGECGATGTVFKLGNVNDLGRRSLDKLKYMGKSWANVER